MAKSTKSKSRARREAAQSDNKVEARPIGQGKDPLAEGARLHNPTNSEAETHYDADTSELDAEAQAVKNRIDGQDANERAEEHNAQAVNAADSDVPNSDAEEQDAVAEGRTEEEANPPVDDTLETTE